MLRGHVTHQTLRSPRPGDICVLLVPPYSEAANLRLILGHLQQQFGGEIAAPIHLNCQRFRATPQELAHLEAQVDTLVSQTPPLVIYGDVLEPVYSTFRDLERLRLRLRQTEELSTFFASLNHLLNELMLTPLHEALPEGVVLLEDIRMSILKVERYPHKLFSCERLVFSELKAPGRYTALFSVPLSQASPSPALEQFHLD
jgi:hypothetical protein